jgi:hypothetical protein
VDSLQQWEKRDSLSSPSHYGRFIASGEFLFVFSWILGFRSVDPDLYPGSSVVDP